MGQEASRSEWPALLPKVMIISGSLALLQPGSVLMQTSEIKGHVGISRPYYCLCSGDIQTPPLLSTMSGSMLLPWLGSVLNPVPALPTKITKRAKAGNGAGELSVICQSCFK